MVYVDDDTKEKLKKIKKDSVYFLINFDNVITDSDSCDSWNLIKNNVKLNKSCLKKFDNLIFSARSIELNEEIDECKKCDLLKDTYKEALELIKSFDIDENKIRRFVNNKKSLRLRDGAKKFLKGASNENIPVVIVSDGISEVIKCVLKCNDCYYDNIYITSNSLFYDTDNDINKIIHSLNKNETSLADYFKDKIKDRKICILFASSINDINMISKDKLNDSIKVAFLDKNINENFDMYLNYFNVIYTHDSSFDIMINRIKKLSSQKK